MSNVWANPTIIAKEMLRQLKNNCVMAELVHRGYEEEWMKTYNGFKPGQTITVKAPLYFRVKDGSTIDTVDIKERTTSFTLGYRKHVAWEVTAEEMTYNIDQISERCLKPAAQALGNYVDTSLLGLYKSIPAQVGTPGTTPSSFLTLAQANAKLSEMACPPDARRCVVDPQAQAYLSDALKGLYLQPVVAKAVEQAKIGRTAGMDIYESQNVAMHTAGTWAGTSGVTANATSAEGDATLVLACGSALTVKQGDIFTIAAVNAVNPISGLSTGSPRQFVVDADGTFNTTLTTYCTPGTSPYQIYDASATENYLPYQNVDVLPQSTAAVTIAGTASQQYRVNLAFHKDCLGLAMVPIQLPVSTTWKAQESYDGYTVTVTRGFDIINYKEYVRFDILFGIKTLNPFLGCRVAG